MANLRFFLKNRGENAKHLQFAHVFVIERQKRQGEKGAKKEQRMEDYPLLPNDSLRFVSLHLQSSDLTF